LIPIALASFRGYGKKAPAGDARRHEDDFGYHAKKDNSAFLQVLCPVRQACDKGRYHTQRKRLQMDPRHPSKGT
jgi:hypothetical protein